MKFWTYGEIKSKVLRDLDMEGETFVTPDEMLGYANEAVDTVERTIHTLYEDYFVTRGTMTLIPGEELYAIPDNIYALKIRQIIYRNGAQVWKLGRLKDWHKFGIYETEKANFSGTQQYGYFVVNSTPGAPEILITPTPTEAGSYLQIWYIRNANALINDASICDIPEAINYVIAHIKMRCMEKEMHPNLAKAIQDVEQEKQETLTTLADMYSDNENNIEPDYRLYSEMTGRMD